MITILKNFTYVGSSGSTWIGEWIRVPEEYLNWDLAILVHSRVAGTNATLTAESSWDTGVVATVGTPASISTAGLSNNAIVLGMGPFFRVRITSGADSFVTLSVWLTQKVT